jgi:esterase/lipase superfamily enzyme
MSITVYFATNRATVGPKTDVQSYGATIVPPSDLSQVTYATAFVEDAGLTADTTGAIDSIQDVSMGTFSPQALDDLANAGRNLLIFIHGFANTFENGITRAAFNQQWFASAQVLAAETTVITFTWPSLGEVISSVLDPTGAYFQDQTMAGQSGMHISGFFSNLKPVIDAAHAQGRRVFLLTHSMGNWALQAAVESWFAHGMADAFLFDEAILAAADEIWTTFDYLPIGRLSALDRLARRISTYRSESDDVLKLSTAINLAKRLGQDGPNNASDLTRFPPSKYRVVDCTAFNDYTPFDFQTSHQYYRRSPGVLSDIVKTMVGDAGPTV